MALIDVVNKIKSDIKAVADAIREKNNLTGELTLEQMADEVAWISGTGEEDQTYILIDEDGNELPAVRTEEVVALTATANDIRIGTLAVTDQGIIEGSKEIPSYNTSEGYRLIPSGSKFELPTLVSLERYNFTKFQAIICPYAGSISDSVAAEKVAINEAVYNVKSTEIVSTVIRNENSKTIDLGFTNEGEDPCLLRYFTYKEIY